MFSCSSSYKVARNLPYGEPVIVADAGRVDSLYLTEFQEAAARENSFAHNPYIAFTYQNGVAQLDSLRDLPILAQARGVSAYVNDRVTYRHDFEIYGCNEYWASGIETIARRHGDCEDYAIAEFEGLKHLNADPNRYRLMLVAVRPEHKERDGIIDHCVLAVDTSAANDWTSCLVFGESHTEGQLVFNTGFKPVYYLTPTSIERIREAEAPAYVQSQRRKALTP